MRRDAYGQLAGNSYPARHPVRVQAPSTPWAMYLADDTGTFRLLCFDFDGKKAGQPDPDLMEAAADDADALSRILDRLQVTHALCESSGTGGRHIWVHIPGGIDKALAGRLGRAARALYSTLDHGMLANAREGAARPPLSPHRDGSRSKILRGSPESLLHSEVSAEQIDSLCEALLAACPPLVPEAAPSSQPQSKTRRAHRRLSSAGESHMATIRGGDNPSWTGFMCLLSAAHAGWSFADVQRAAETAPGMEHYRTKNTGRGGARRPRHPTERHARLERQWAKAQQIAGTHAVLGPSGPPAEAIDVDDLVQRLDVIEAAMTHIRATPGRWAHTEAGQSARSVLAAIAYLTIATGKATVAAPIRTVALLTGLGRTTAADALRRLSDDGLLRRSVASDDTGNAAEWRFSDRFSTASVPVRSQPIKNPRPPTAPEVFARRRALAVELENELVDGRHDVFTRGGLGHMAGRLFAETRERTVTDEADAARVLGTVLRHARRAMSRLTHHKLIRRHADLSWRPNPRDRRAIVAKELGVGGVLQRRSERYQLEREVWSWWLAELDAMHTAPRRRRRRGHATSRPLFEGSSPGERSWPRYPRTPAGLAEHRAARSLVAAGVVSPESRWQYLGDVA
ncbi:hypothetical protein GCM10010988_41200 [Cnuibacter physcomitrellae]|nr:hypothetical protein [Cnuibacter physcomitrellae]GGI42870.1 hypothetical protein GCM10010988_41200 [Cnuibacter physcomitrellae]